MTEANIDNINLLLNSGKFESALNLINQLLSSKLAYEDQIRIKILKARYYVKQGQFQNSLDIAEPSLKEINSVSYNKLMIDILLLISEAYWRIGKAKDSRKAIERAEELIKEYKEDDILFQKGNIEHNKASIYLHEGKLDDAINYFSEALTLRNQISNNLYGIGETLNSLGVTYYYKGQLVKALDYYKESLNVKQKLGNKQQIAIALNNIGDVYHTQGELNLAWNYYNQSLDLFEEIGNNEHIFSGLHNLGKVFYQKGEFNTALEYFDKALKVGEIIDNKISLSENLFHQIGVAIEKKDKELIEKYANYLKSISETTDNKIIKQRNLVSQALILKNKNQRRDKIKAQEILQSILLDEIVNHELRVSALLHLCELLLYELRLTMDPEEEKYYFEEIKKLSGILLKTAQDQQLHSLLSETYLLQSRLAIMEFDIQKSLQLITTANMIAEERGLKKLAQTISIEMDLLSSQLIDWKVILKQKPQIKSLSELIQISDLVNRMIKKRVYKNQQELKDYILDAKKLIETWDASV